MTKEVYSAQQTRRFGREMGEKAAKGDIYCLRGELGAGKTVFTKGFAEGLGIKDHITSPTFTIINEYMSGRLPLYHFDVYRIGSSDEMYETGCDEYFFGDGVCLIEWAELIEDILPENVTWINIYKDPQKDNINYRRIEVAQ